MEHGAARKALPWQDGQGRRSLGWRIVVAIVMVGSIAFAPSAVSGALTPEELPMLPRPYCDLGEWASFVGCAAWHTQYDGPKSAQDRVIDITVADDGMKVFTLIRSTGDATRERDHATADFVVRAQEAETGAVVWTRRYDGPAGANDEPRQVLAGPGRIYVAGDSENGIPRSFRVVAYETGSGNVAWDSPRLGETGFPGQASRAALSVGDGTLVVAGQGMTLMDAELRIAAYHTATGAVKWTLVERANVVRPIEVLDVKISEGVVLVAASIPNFIFTEPSWLGVWAYRLSDGARVWSTLVEGMNPKNQPSPAIAVIDDTILVAGESLVALDSHTGNQRWVRESEYIGGVASTPDQSAFVATRWDPSGAEAVLISMDGVVIWRSDLSSEFEATRVTDLAVAGDSVAITGGKTLPLGPTQAFVAILRLSNGTTTLEALAGGLDPTGGHAIALSATGERAFVGVTSMESVDRTLNHPDKDAYTFAFDADQS